MQREREKREMTSDVMRKVWRVKRLKRGRSKGTRGRWLKTEQHLNSKP